MKLMNSMPPVLLIVILLVRVEATSGGEPAPALASFRQAPPAPVGDLSHVLKIREVSGEYRLTQKATEVRLRLDFYKKGEKLEDWTRKFGRATTPELAADSGQVAVQIVNLDYLPLGEAKPGHHRISMQVTLDKETSSMSFDIPKTAFDVSEVYALQAFRAKDESTTQAPLFHIIGGGVGTVRGGGRTAEEVVRDNPEGDVLVATLEFE